MKKGEGDLTLQEAIDHLINMSEIDMKDREETKEAIDSLTFKKIDWANPKAALANEPLIREIFLALRQYLKNLFETEREKLKEDRDVQNGLRAMMSLVEESVKKMDTYGAIAAAGRLVSHFPEYRELQDFYLNTVVKEFGREFSPELGFEEKAEELTEHEIKNVEAVRKDREYELFFIKREDGKPYFNKELLRHLKLVGNFDQLIESTESEDPLPQLKVIQDKEVYMGANDILASLLPYIDSFFKQRTQLKEIQLVKGISNSILAIMMAAHFDNLLENNSNKGCISYYNDFHSYLRATFSTEEYQVLITNAIQKDTEHFLLKIIHGLSYFFFTRSGFSEEAVTFIHKLIQKGKNLKKESPKIDIKDPFWKSFLENDQAIRHLLAQYPSGPLLKTFDVLCGEEKENSFDPLKLENFPFLLYPVILKDTHTSVLRLPSPTRQFQVEESKVVPEFLGMLRYFQEAKSSSRHLLINLQNRISWAEQARCKALENLSKESEFASVIAIVTLPRETDFYFQVKEYEVLNGAPLFIEELLRQMTTKKEGHYFFSESLQEAKVLSFTKKTAQLIHHHFFAEKSTLSRQERMQFIDLFFYFLVLALLEYTKCNSLSFTCKDAVDAGAAMSAGFYAFLRILSKERRWSKEKKDFLLWLFYYPALTVRERAIEPVCFTRTIFALEALEKKMSRAIHKAFEIPSIEFPVSDKQ